MKFLLLNGCLINFTEIREIEECGNFYFRDGTQRCGIKDENLIMRITDFLKSEKRVYDVDGHDWYLSPAPEETNE